MGNIFAIIFLIVWLFIAFKLGAIVSKFKLPSVLAALVLGFIVSPHFLGKFIPAYGKFSHLAVHSVLYGIATGLGMIGIGVFMGLSFKKDIFMKSAKQLICIPIFTVIVGVIAITLAFHFLLGASWMLSILVGAISTAAIPAYPIATVKELKSSGAVSGSVVPMASIDMAVSFLIFMACASIALGYYSLVSAPIYYVLIMFIASGVFGIVVAWIFKHLTTKTNKTATAIIFLVISIISILVAQVINKKLGYTFLIEPLYGLTMGIFFANRFKTAESAKSFQTGVMPPLWILLVMNIFIIGVSINITLLADVKGILLAGAIIFLITRLLSKYLGYFIGGKIFKASKSVTNKVGIALLGFCANGSFFVFYINKMVTQAHGNPIAYHGIHLIQFLTIIIISASIVNDLIAVPINPLAFKDEIGKAPESTPSQS